LKWNSIMLQMADPIYVGDVVELRKAHPCGGVTWEVTRVGADIGVLCQTCGRRALLTRREFVRSVKKFVRRGPAPNAGEPTESA
jgi:hypothetical protein